MSEACQVLLTVATLIVMELSALALFVVVAVSLSKDAYR